MAYNPSLYNPYGSQQFQPTISYHNQYMSSPAPPSQQPINGLIWIDSIEEAQMFPLPPNSTSYPLMFRNEPRFAVKTTDGSGAYTIETFSFIKDEVETTTNDSDFVTKSDLDKYLDKFKQDILEAINGQSSTQAATATE